MRAAMMVLVSVAAAWSAAARPQAAGAAKGADAMGTKAAAPATRLFPCLWFEKEADEALRWHRAAFPDAKLVDEMRGGDVGPLPKGALVAATLELDGQRLMLLNGGPPRAFTEAASIVVEVGTQAELDRVWTKLVDGGSESMCGWLKDRFGVSWQVVPRVLGELMRDKDPAVVGRVTAAMLKMRKLDVAALLAARDAR